MSIPEQSQAKFGIISDRKYFSGKFRRFSCQSRDKLGSESVTGQTRAKLGPISGRSRADLNVISCKCQAFRPNSGRSPAHFKGNTGECRTQIAGSLTRANLRPISGQSPAIIRPQAEFGPILGPFRGNLGQLSDLELFAHQTQANVRPQIVCPLNLSESRADFRGILCQCRTLNRLPAELGRLSGRFRGNLVPMSDPKSLAR